jgi:hypothetical protein
LQFRKRTDRVFRPMSLRDKRKKIFLGRDSWLTDATPDVSALLSPAWRRKPVPRVVRSVTIDRPEDASTTVRLERLIDRLEAAIGELGDEGVVEDRISDDLIGGADSLPPDEVLVIPGHMDDASRPILLTVTRDWNGKAPLSSTRVIRQVQARLIAARGGIEHLAVLCDDWDSLRPLLAIRPVPTRPSRPVPSGGHPPHGPSSRAAVTLTPDDPVVAGRRKSRSPRTAGAVGPPTPTISTGFPAISRMRLTRPARRMRLRAGSSGLVRGRRGESDADIRELAGPARGGPAGCCRLATERLEPRGGCIREGRGGFDDSSKYFAGSHLPIRPGS